MEVVRKRGRPPKNVTQQTIIPVISHANPSDETDSNDKMTEGTRKRGRPPKKSSTPVISQGELCDAADSNDKMTEGTRKRGRPPKKSLTQQTVTPGISDETDSFMIETPLSEVIDFYSTIEDDDNAESLLMTFLNKKFTESGVSLHVLPIMNHLSKQIFIGSQSNSKLIFILDCLNKVVNQYFNSRIALLQTMNEKK